jgi:TM2 domain-containing membrane protein YozV
MPKTVRLSQCQSPSEEMVWGGRPSLGVALIFSTFGFGSDRFYVGQVGAGIALLIAYLTVFGAAVAVPIQWLSGLSLVFAILGNRTTAFMYGNMVFFDPPTTFDKVLAVIWILLMVFFIILIPTSAAIVLH